MDASHGSRYWFVYIAVARTGRYYTGISKNPAKRIADHNNGKGARFARLQGELMLVYISSPFETKASARIREVQIKHWSQQKKSKLTEGIYT